MKAVNEVIGDYSGQSKKVLEYSLLMKRLVDEAKHPGFCEASWDPLKELIAVEDFVRVGNFKEVMNWADYLAFLTPWAMSSNWECSFKRITEQGNVVFLELEERSEIGDFKSVVNSVSVYEFNSQGKIHHVDIYLQMEMPGEEVLQNYTDVETTAG